MIKESISKFHKQVFTNTTCNEPLIKGAKDHPLVPGDVLIATNLAGRGTDLEISAECEDNGGLHVVLTYMPPNIRIEIQAFGRAARNGQKGSGQFCIITDK